LLCVALLAISKPALAQFTQQGGKLVGTGGVGIPAQATSLAISADGNTAIVGGINDNNGVGAAWIFIRNGGTWTQQGPKLVGLDAVGAAQMGASVAISADGNVAIVGGLTDDTDVGAAWIFVRSGDVWGQAGSKLVGNDATGSATQGAAVAISADGGTVLVGGPADNSSVGAAWVFVRSSGAWIQQGSKLVGNDAVSASNQGAAVALSADGNNAIVGGTFDNGGTGAAWVYTRSNGAWSQQGAKLVGSGGSGAGLQGQSVVLSADGNTAIVGGFVDAGNMGAVWVYTRSAGAWTQQGGKLVGTGAVGTPLQGNAVTVSGDGNTLMVGGPADDFGRGAVWVFTRSAGVWTQFGSKLTGSGASGTSNQGNAVALSGDGNIAIIGGPKDNSFQGAAWVFTRPPVMVATTTSLTASANPGKLGQPVTLTATVTGTAPTGSVNFGFGDGGSQTVALANRTASVVHTFAIAASYSLSATYSGDTVYAGGTGTLTEVIAAATAHDLNGDGASDVVWRDEVGNVQLWRMNGGALQSSVALGGISTLWSIVGQRDVNGDGKSDLLWRDAAGNVQLWLMNGGSVTSVTMLGNVPISWSVVGTGDFNGDGKGDVLWRDGGGNVAIWFMNGTAIASSVTIGNIPANWSVVGTADFDGNGKSDILWRDGGGNVAAWFMNGATLASVVTLGNIPANWSVVGTGDFDGNGKGDILWRDGGGNVAVWFMNGATIASVATLGNIPANWNVAQTGDYNGDGKSDILWRDGGGNVALWLMNGAAIASVINVGNIPANWSVQGINAD
jgi:hypothetical protein